MFSSLAFRFHRAFLLGVAAVVLAGCSTTGNNFDTTDLRFLVPGQTTLEEAKVLLQGEPTNIYRQVNGAATARWAYGASLVNDAVYFNQELWLAFDPYGRFERIVKSTNVPHANLYQDGRRVDVPAPAAPHSPATPYSGSAPYGATPPAATPNSLSRTAVTYPLGQ